MSDIRSLQEDRNKLTTEMNTMTSKASESKEWSSEDEQKFQKLNTDQEKLRTVIQRVSDTEKLTRELKEVKETPAGREEKAAPALLRSTETAKNAEMDAYRSYLMNGEKGMSNDEVHTLRTLSNLTGAAGGYAAPPFPADDFTKILNNLSEVRSAPVRIKTTNSGNTLLWPTFNDTANTGNETSETSNIDEDVDPTFGQVEIKAFNFDSDIVKISRQFMQDSIIPVEQLINEACGERIAKRINLRYTTGAGVTTCQGILTGSTDSGVTFPRDVAGDPGDAGAVYRKLVELKFSVAAVYRKSKSFAWMFSDEMLQNFVGVTDLQGRPAWTASMVADEPDRLCGVPYYINSDMPAIVDEAKTILIGDLSQFLIRDVATVEFIRLNELYARGLMVGFVAHFRTDSRVLNAAAIKYGTIEFDEYYA